MHSQGDIDELARLLGVTARMRLSKPLPADFAPPPRPPPAAPAEAAEPAAEPAAAAETALPPSRRKSVFSHPAADLHSNPCFCVDYGRHWICEARKARRQQHIGRLLYQYI